MTHISKAIFCACVASGVSLLLIPAVHAQQDRYAVTAPNGVKFGEFKGYEDWPVVAVSQVDGGIKAIMANPAMIAAYRKGVPGNGAATRSRRSSLPPAEAAAKPRLPSGKQAWRLVVAARVPQRGVAQRPVPQGPVMQPPGSGVRVQLSGPGVSGHPG